MHGLKFINSGYSLKRRVVWCLLVLAGVVFFSTQFAESLKKFFAYRVNTVVHMSNDGTTKFPAVTICNQNALKKSELEKHKNDSLIKKLLQKTRQYMRLSQNPNEKTNFSNVRISGEEMRKTYFKYGHNMENITNGGMLEFCRRPDQTICKAEDFVRALTYSGLCYTLNSARPNVDGQIRKVVYSSMSGRFAAIRLVLSVQVRA